MKSIQPSASEALERLKKGNARFVECSQTGSASQFRKDLALGQSPFAIILSCSDSRAPSEIVFDQGLGDLFVIRVAGNIVAPSLIGSVEFAAGTFGTQLVVVMGHTQCGAVGATLDVVERGIEVASENILDIVQRIRPGVEELGQSGAPRAELMKLAVRANVRASANQLRHGSRILEKLIAKGRLTVVEAEYSLETGTVDFFA
jgi:carbonic anhydrase